MRTDVEIQLSPEDRVRLEKLVAAPMTPQKHVWRAQIVLLSAAGVGTRTQLEPMALKAQEATGCEVLTAQSARPSQGGRC